MGIMEQKMQERMDDFYKEMAEEENKRYEKDMSVLNGVKKQVEKDLFKDIEHYMKELDCAFNFSIVEEAPNDKHKQTEAYDYMKEIWVNQYCNGGYVGDDFAGQIWIKITNKKWFTFHYSC